MSTAKASRVGRWVVAGLLLAATGCASWRTPAPVPPLFYPPDPQLARLQYLTSFTLPRDIGLNQSAVWTALIGPPEPLPGIGKPYGVKVKQGRIYVCDTSGAVVHIIDLRLRRWDYFSPEGIGRLRKPINICVDGDGTRYIADSGRGQVVVFDAAGAYVDVIGAPEAMKPTDVEVNDARLYVADLKSRSVRVYDRKDRSFLFAIPRGETNAASALIAPVNIALDGQGRLFVSDAGKFCVQQYDAEGRFLRAVGTHGDGPGTFARNRGLTVDRENHLYVVDAAFENSQIFDDQGRPLLYFGDRGSGQRGALLLPADVAIDYEDTDLYLQQVAPGFDLEYVVLITSQYGDRKLNIYGYLRRSSAPVP